MKTTNSRRAESFLFLTVALLASVLANTTRADEPVELLRDPEFKQGFVFWSPDLTNEYRKANKMVTNAGLVALNISLTAEDDYTKLVGANRLGSPYAVPVWVVNEGGAVGYNISSTPYSAAHDYDVNGYPLGGVAGCPQVEAGTDACVWEGTSMSASGNIPIVSLVAGRGLPTRDADIKFRLNQMGQWTTWGTDGFWGRCTSLHENYTRVAGGETSNQDSRCRYYNGTDYEPIQDLVGGAGVKDHFQTDSMLFQLGANPGSGSNSGQDPGILAVTQNLIGDLQLGNMESLVMKGKIKLNRKDRIDYTTSGAHICNAGEINNNRWDPLYKRWSNCYLRSSIEDDGAGDWDKGVVDLGFRIANNLTGAVIWVGIINSTDTNADVVLVPGGNSDIYRTKACRTTMTDPESVNFSELADPASWDCDYSFDVYSGGYMHLPSFVFYNNNNTYPPAVQLNPASMVTLYTGNPQDYPVGYDPQVVGRCYASPANYLFDYKDLLDGDNDDPVDSCEGKSYWLNTPVYDYETANVQLATQWVPFETRYDTGNGVYDLLSWIQEALNDAKAANSAIDNDLSHYHLLDVGFSLEQGGPIDTEVQLKDLSFSATYISDSQIKNTATAVSSFVQ